MVKEIVTLLQAFGGSGIAALIAAIYTKRVSGGGKQASAEPNGARTRLQDEVVWLRHQLDIERMKK